VQVDTAVIGRSAPNPKIRAIANTRNTASTPSRLRRRNSTKDKIVTKLLIKTSIKSTTGVEKIGGITKGIATDKNPMKDNSETDGRTNAKEILVEIMEMISMAERKKKSLSKKKILSMRGAGRSSELEELIPKRLSNLRTNCKST